MKEYVCIRKHKCVKSEMKATFKGAKKLHFSVLGLLGLWLLRSITTDSRNRCGHGCKRRSLNSEPRLWLLNRLSHGNSWHLRHWVHLMHLLHLGIVTTTVHLHRVAWSCRSHRRRHGVAVMVSRESHWLWHHMNIRHILMGLEGCVGHHMSSSYIVMWMEGWDIMMSLYK